MIIRRFFSILLNILAVFVPALVLFRVFGLDATVNPESIKHVLAILGTALFSFVVGLISAALLRSTDKPFLESIVHDLMSWKGPSENERLPNHPRRKAA